MDTIESMTAALWSEALQPSCSSSEGGGYLPERQWQEIPHPTLSPWRAGSQEGSDSGVWVPRTPAETPPTKDTKAQEVPGVLLPKQQMQKIARLHCPSPASGRTRTSLKNQPHSLEEKVRGIRGPHDFSTQDAFFHSQDNQGTVEGRPCPHWGAEKEGLPHGMALAGGHRTGPHGIKNVLGGEADARWRWRVNYKELQKKGGV